MRESIKEFVNTVAQTLPIQEPIFEFGSLQVPGQEGFADLRPFFPKKDYVGCDMQEGTGVDRILNLHSIDLPSETVGTVLIMDTLEHVEYPHKAIEESCRILKPKGLIVISSVMKFPIHDYPDDYWRFTPEAFKSLLKPFPWSFAGFAGDKDFPDIVVGIGYKDSSLSTRKFKPKFEGWRKKWSNPLRIEPFEVEKLLGQVSHLGQQNKAHERTLKNIYKSRSWKLITFLRQLKRKTPFINNL